MGQLEAQIEAVQWPIGKAVNCPLPTPFPTPLFLGVSQQALGAEDLAGQLAARIEEVQWPLACERDRIMHVSLNDTSGFGVTLHLLSQVSESCHSCVSESCHMREWVVSHICVSRVTRMCLSCLRPGGGSLCTCCRR